MQRYLQVLVFVVAACWSCLGYAQEKVLPVLGKIVRHDAAADALLPADAKIEVVGSGFTWIEGPAWVRDGGYLLFSDIPRNSVMKYDPAEGVSLFLKPSGYTGVAEYGYEPGSNGLAIDAEGRLISCEHGDRRVSRMERDGGKRTLADNYQGKRFNSPNDLTIMSNGDIYFTDPPYGLPKGAEDPRRELDFCGVFRVATNGTVTLLHKDLVRPNGIALSADEKILMVAQSEAKAATYTQFDVQADGTLANPRVFFDATSWMGKLGPGAPDGIKFDAAGNLWASGPGGIHVFSPQGKHLAQIATGQATSNCNWGDDGSTLYITADKYICRVKTTTRGAGW